MHYLQHIEKHKNLQIFDLVIRDRQSLQFAFKDVACVIHLAGIVGIVPAIENPLDYYETNGAYGAVFGVFLAQKANKSV